MAPLTNGQFAPRQIPLSALSSRQRAVLNVLRDHGPIAEERVLPLLAREVPAFAALPQVAIAHTLQLLYEANHAEPTAAGWITRTIERHKD